jgi:pimeloyl-ACP methyl ester carboxylesterase
MKLLLIHGAGLGPWIWDRMLPHLRVPAIAVERGPTLDACVERVLSRIDGETILVGHSIGACIAMVAATRAKVPVVLVGGMVPESGKNFLSLLPLPARLFLRPMLRKETIALPQSLVKKDYCNGLDAATTELVLRNVTAEASRLYLDAVEWSVGRTSYVKLLADHSLKPRKQDAIASRVGAQRVVTMDTGHLPMLSRPEELAAMLNELAQPKTPDS